MASARRHHRGNDTNSSLALSRSSLPVGPLRIRPRRRDSEAGLSQTRLPRRQGEWKRWQRRRQTSYRILLLLFRRDEKEKTFRVAGFGGIRGRRRGRAIEALGASAVPAVVARRGLVFVVGGGGGSSRRDEAAYRRAGQAGRGWQRRRRRRRRDVVILLPRSSAVRRKQIQEGTTKGHVGESPSHIVVVQSAGGAVPSLPSRNNDKRRMRRRCPDSRVRVGTIHNRRQ
mmetsp:Transcript_1514/g.3381  ORF Transcript_1514/g.3381 Transcript_1514/m.3381 type:complete len:228 (+) Transcript_1514:1098-1781(+)